MQYIIMCGGTYHAWEKPRQLAEINGEPVIARTIRLLRETGVKDIAISSDNPVFEQFGVPILKHDNNFTVSKQLNVDGCWCNAFYPMDEPACYLFGDVVFSPEAIKTIVTTQTDSIQFFASSPPYAPEYIKQHAEPFAFKVTDQKRFRAAIDFAVANANTGIFCRPPIAWELWQVIRGKDVCEIDFDSYVIINDYTCDIDSAGDVQKFEGLIK